MDLLDFLNPPIVLIGALPSFLWKSRLAFGIFVFLRLGPSSSPGSQHIFMSWTHYVRGFWDLDKWTSGILWGPDMDCPHRVSM